MSGQSTDGTERCIDCGDEYDIPEEVDRCPGCFTEEYGLIDGMARLKGRSVRTGTDCSGGNSA
jgi:NMD protein affecting ribosome stability and mRNA decay